MRFFSEAEWKIILYSVSGATVLALLITILVTASGRSADRREAYEQAVQRSDAPDITEFIIPGEFTLTGGERWYFSREPLSRWTDEQVRRFWIDPEKIGIDLLEQKSNKIIEEFLEGVP